VHEIGHSFSSDDDHPITKFTNEGASGLGVYVEDYIDSIRSSEKPESTE